MTNKISYNFESFKKLKLDLSDKIQEISEIEQCWVALAYLSRQSAMFKKCNSVVNVFPSNVFDEYIIKAKNEIKKPGNLHYIVNELDKIIPDGEESCGWEFDFVQNSLLSFVSFFNFLIDRKTSLFIDVVLGVLINIDIVWSEGNDEVDGSIKLSKEVTLLYTSIRHIKKLKDKESIIYCFPKINSECN